MNGTLMDTTTSSQNGPESNSNDGYSILHKSLDLDPHHQIQFSIGSLQMKKIVIFGQTNGNLWMNKQESSNK